MTGTARSLLLNHRSPEGIEHLESSRKPTAIEGGHPEKCNATITNAVGFLTAERIGQDPSLGWDGLAPLNPDLRQWPNEQLTNLCPNGAVHSELAR